MTSQKPLRVIVDARLKTPPTAKTLSLSGEVLVLTTRALEDPAARALLAAGARVERVAGNAEHCDLRAVIEHLAALEINDVWVEAGAGLNGALLREGLGRRDDRAAERKHRQRARVARRRLPCYLRRFPQSGTRLADHRSRQQDGRHLSGRTIQTAVTLVT